jgi:hypothetical protein
VAIEQSLKEIFLLAHFRWVGWVQENKANFYFDRTAFDFRVRKF